MPRANLGRAVESLVESVVRETVNGMKHRLPSQKQIDRVEDRLRELDRRVSRIARKTGARKKTGGKVGRPRKNPLTCRIKNCVQPARAKALCSRHYQQRRRRALAQGA